MRAVTRQEEEHAAQACSSSPALPVLAGYMHSFIWDSHGWAHNSTAAPRINSQCSQAWLEVWAMHGWAKQSTDVIWAFSHFCSDLHVRKGTGVWNTDGVIMGVGLWSYSGVASPKVLSSLIQRRPSQSQKIHTPRILEVKSLKRIIKVKIK